MAEDRLRELERRFKETGSVEDEAAWLQERVRVGDLSQERLELAAYCGHEAARVVLGDAAPEVPSALEEWVEVWAKACWVRAPHSLAALAESALAIADLSRPLVPDSVPLPFDLPLLVATTRRWLESPTPELQAEIRKAALQPWEVGNWPGGEGGEAYCAAELAAAALGRDRILDAGQCLTMAAGYLGKVIPPGDVLRAIHDHLQSALLGGPVDT